MTRKLYAIGFKSWVEIRSASKPPWAETTSFDKSYFTKVIVNPTAEQYREYYDAPRLVKYPMPRFENVERTLKLRQTIYIGGRVVAVVKSDKLRVVLGFAVGKGKRYLLTKIDMKRLAAAGFPQLLKLKGITNV